MIIIWTVESKPIGEKGFQHIPIFVLVSSVNFFNGFLVRCVVKQDQRYCKYASNPDFFKFIFYVMNLESIIPVITPMDYYLKVHC